jgi:hypothetical protein
MADSTPSLIDQVLSAVKAIANASAEDIAKVLGAYQAAKAAIATVAGGVASAASQATINTVNAKYHSVPLSPAVLATAIVRNVLGDSSGGAGTAPANYPAPVMTDPDFGTANAEALLSGLDADRFKALVAATGISYGVIDALRMLNRNTNLWGLTPGPNFATGVPLYTYGTDLGPQYGISADEFAEVVAHSDIRSEYIPDLLKLARNSYSPADVVEMVVKQIIPEAIGQNLYAAAGGIPEQFAALVDAAGDAAGIEKSVELYAHGVITEGQLEQIVGMSRMNPRFYYLTKPDKDGNIPLNSRWLAPYEVGEAISAGTVSAAEGLTWLLEMGYDQAQATAFTTAKGTAKVAKVKEDTVGQILKMYGAKLWTADQATTALSNLGYEAAAIPVLLAQAEAQAIIAAHNSAVNRVRSAYLVGQVDDTQATVALQSLGVPTAAINDFVADWHVERTTPSHHLSVAEVGWFLEHGYITAEAAQAKWVAMGYGADDAALLLLRYPWPGEQPAGTGTPAATAG